MKKFVLFLFTLVIGFAVFCGLKIKADGIVVTMETGAQIRAEGEFQGLRFAASINTLEGVDEHGFYLAIGNWTQSEIEEAIEAGADTIGEGVNEKKLLPKPATGSDLDFAVTIYGMDELSEYTALISTVAYARVGAAYYYGDVQTRNIAEIAFNAVNGGRTGDIITAVTSAVKANYMVKSGSLNVFNEYTITEIQTVKYSFSNLSALYAEFLSDYNAATGASLTTECTDSEFYSSLKIGVAVSDWTIDPTDNIAKMFSGYNLTKWKWLLDYFSSHAAGVHISNQANALLSIDRTAAGYKLHSMEHLVYSFWNFFHTTTMNSPGNGYIPNKFANEAAYSSVVWPEATDFNDENVVAIGDTITLSSAPVRNGYSFVKYNDGTNDYQPGDTYTISSSVTTIKPVYSAVIYGIAYETNGGVNGSNPSSYTIETPTITLEAPTKTGYVFAGWYSDAGFTDGPITSIPKGSTGEKELFAKWTDPEPEALSASSTDVAILNEVTPDIIVKSGLSARYYLEGTGLKSSYANKCYTYNTNAFTSISAAVAAASAGDTIYVFAGTYSDSFTINKTLSLYGSCYNLEMKHTDTFTENSTTQSIINSTVTISGCSNVNVRGFVTKGHFDIIGVEEISFSNMINKSSFDGAFYFKTTASSDATFDKIYHAGSSARLVCADVKVTDFTYQNSAVLDGATVSSTNTVDIIRFGKSDNGAYAYGDITIRNSYFRAYQSGFMDRSPTTATSYIIENNYFIDTEVAIYFRSATVSISQSHIIRYNTFIRCGKNSADWDLMNITNGTNTSTTINYNIFVDSDYGTGTYGGKTYTDYIIMIRTASKGSFDLTNNYFWNTTRNDTADFGNTYCVKNPPASGGLTLWSLAPATTTASTYDPYQVVNIGGQYYIYGINLTTN